MTAGLEAADVLDDVVVVQPLQQIDLTDYAGEGFSGYTTKGPVAGTESTTQSPSLPAFNATVVIWQQLPDGCQPQVLTLQPQGKQPKPVPQKAPKCST